MSLNNKLSLAIETSCDDTAISIAKNNKIIDEKISSSIFQHKKYGGVVPEIAARSHEQNIFKNLVYLFNKNNLSIKNLDKIFYTSTPGLPGSLHVGKSLAKSLTIVSKAKLIPLDHMMGHAFSFLLSHKIKVKFPIISVVISGGNTIIYLFYSYKKYKILNETSDDAIGEVLDKIGRELGWKYPGGINIDLNFNPKKINMKLINHSPVDQQISFSGFKTYVLNYINNQKQKKKKIDKVLIGSSCLYWLVNELKRKIDYYVTKYKISTVAFGGGVSANNYLRSVFKNNKNIKYLFPEKKYCGDNSSMLLAYGINSEKE